MDFFLHGNRLDKQIGDRGRIQNPREEQVHGTVPYRTVVMQSTISHLMIKLQVPHITENQLCTVLQNVVSLVR
jgi:hypothetical protein